MANQKTTQFPAAATLTGAEVVGIVQDGGDVKTTLEAISSYTFSGNLTPNVVLGGETYASSEYGGQVVIGNQLATALIGSIAIGYKTDSSGTYSIGIGYAASVGGTRSIVIGSTPNIPVTDNFAVVIGAFGKSEAYGVAIGYGAGASSHSVAIGFETLCFLDNEASVAIGHSTYVSASHAIGIGHQASVSNQDYGIALGYQAQTSGIHAISIGSYTISTEAYSVAIGYGAHSTGDHALAIGAYASADTSGASAIGVHALAHTNGSVAIGKSAFSSGLYTVSIGKYANTYSANILGIAIGYDAVARSAHSIVIGGEASTGSPHSLVVGDQASAGSEGYGSITIGGSSYSDGTSIVIGYNSTSNFGDMHAIKSIVIGKGVRVGSGAALAIGYDSYINTNAIGSMAIGPYASVKDSPYGIAFGWSSYARLEKSMAFGYHAQSTGISSVAIGTTAQSGATGSIALGIASHASGPYSLAVFGTTDGGYSMAFGKGAVANNTYSVVFGSASDSSTASFVVAGYPNTNFTGTLTPVETKIKMTAITQAAAAASFSFTVGTTTATITYNTPGTGGNSALFEITNPSPSPNGSPFINAGPTALQIGLPTDGDGNVIPLALNDIDLSATNFTLTFGDGTQEITAALTTQSLTGGVNASGPLPLTITGSPIGSRGNTFILPESTMASLSGTVVGFEHAIFGGSADAASFTLAPSLCYASNNSTYHFVGSAPDFSLVSSTAGAADWVVPTIAITGSGSSGWFKITVDDQDASSIGWMGFFTLETNQ